MSYLASTLAFFHESTQPCTGSSFHQGSGRQCAPDPAMAGVAFSSLVFLLLLFRVGSAVASGGARWVNHGNGLRNWRSAAHEKKIRPNTVNNLALKWAFTVGNDTSATPAIADGVVYFPSWDGKLYAVDAETGATVWVRNLAQETNLRSSNNPNTVIARATPVVYGDFLIVGIYGPAVVTAWKRSSGQLLWQTQLETVPLSQITMSGTAFQGYYYIGTSSLQEIDAGNPINFRGKVAKLKIATGEVVWETFMLPDNGGQTGLYAGAAVWGSSPSLDVRRGLVFIATCNDYSTPPNVTECELQQLALPVPENPDPCVEPGNRGNSIVALDMDTGAIEWSRVLGGYNAWTVACFSPENPNCPRGPGLDYDFGEAPMLLSIPRSKAEDKSGPHGLQDIVVASQKSGTVWALDRDTGDIVWSTAAGPEGFAGGAIWGSATDGKRVFTNIANSERRNFTLLPSNTVVKSGGWVALDAATGAVLWSTADPKGGFVYGPVSHANGVLLVGSSSPAGAVYALDADTGAVLWSSEEPTGSIYGGFSVADGCVYVGEGYGNNAAFLGTAPATRVLAFCLH